MGKGAVQRLTGSSHQLGIDPIPGSVIAPTTEVSLHRRARWEVPRQGAPLAAGRQNIEDRIDDLTPIPEPRSPPAGGPTGATVPAPPILDPSSRLHSPVPRADTSFEWFQSRPCDLRRSSQPRPNHNRLKSLNSFQASLSGSLDYAVSLDRSPLTLWRSREEPVP